VLLAVGLPVLAVVLWVVLSTGSLIVGGIIGRAIDRPAAHKFARAINGFQTLTTALDLFRLDMGRYPTAKEGLSVLYQPPVGPGAGRWKGPYIAKPMANDPWGNPYVYVFPGVHNVASYDLECYGKDGRDGGEGHDRDLENWPQ
jgi:general secretion pathway protein G